MPPARILILSAVLATAAVATETPRYRDATAPIDARIADLLSRMTLEEKAAQLSGVDNVNKKYADAQGNFVPALAGERLEQGVGQVQQIIRNSYRDAAGSARFVNEVQRFLVEHTRLGIPAIVSEECLHGLMAEDATIFPQAIGLAGTWDPDLVHRVYAAIALEARSRGANQALTPMIDVARDPRWGRMEESYGEDPYLTSRLAVATITGFQGAGPRIDDAHIAATAKHFAAHGDPEGGHNQGAVHAGERELRQVFFPPFRAAVTEAGVKGIMPAYHEVDGVPCHANAWLLRDVLRGEWGFRGVVVSDYNGISMLNDFHFVSPTKEEAGRTAFLAGVTVELSDLDCFRTLPTMVRDGRIPAAVLDQAVTEVLRLKFELGLFDHPYADPARATAISRSSAHMQLAREAAEKAVVLLKNEGALLPLDPAHIKTLAVIGPNADRHLYGGYSVKTSRGFSIRQGLEDRYGARVKIRYAEGCKIHLGDGYWKSRGKIVLNDEAADRALIAEAVQAAKDSDAAVVVVGDDSQLSSETRDVHDLSLVGRQEALVRAVLATGKPVVLVLLNGRPITLNGLATEVPAILEAWYPGEEGGRAVADILFGAVNPSGHLTVSFPRSIGQLPVYYNRKPREKDYVQDDARPLYAFGHGLSYATFQYGAPRLAAAKIKASETARVSIDVTNTSNRAGDTVVQVYVHARFSSVGRGLSALKAFQRVALAAGQTKTVTLDLTPAQLAIWNAQMKEVVEPGQYNVGVGDSSDRVTSVMLEVVP